jgi:hypothetical protein
LGGQLYIERIDEAQVDAPRPCSGQKRRQQLAAYRHGRQQRQPLVDFGGLELTGAAKAPQRGERLGVQMCRGVPDGALEACAHRRGVRRANQQIRTRCGDPYGRDPRCRCDVLKRDAPPRG